MKLILLSRGMSAMVDDEDYDLLKDYKWHVCPSRKTFYCIRKAPSRWPNGRRGKPLFDGPSTILMHRVILRVNDSKIHVDHIDGNGLNNQKNNLRPCTVAQNQFNSLKQDGCSSRFKGVSWNKGARKWRVSFGPSGNRIGVGYYDCEKEAALIYNVVASFAHREFAKLNNLEV